MHRICHATTAVLVVAVTALGPGGVAHAEGSVSASSALLQSNWYWHKAAADAPVAGLPDSPEPSGVPAGDLPVASTDGKGTPSKLSLLAMSLPTVPAGSTVSAFTLTLTIDSAADNVTTETPKLVAELALRGWANGPGGDTDVVNAPPLQAASAVAGKPSADGKSISFAIPAIAQSWVDDINVGLGIVPAKDYTTPFQISFLGGKDVHATMDYTPAAPVPPAAGGTGATTSLPTSAGSAEGSVSTAPLSGAPSLGQLGSGPTGTTGAAPVVVPPITSGPAGAQPTAPVATAFHPLAAVSGRPSSALLWAGAAVAALLVLLSLTLGGEPEAVAHRRTSRLDAELRTRTGRLGARRSTAFS